MELEGKVILVKNTSKSLSPILRTLENFQINQLAYRKDGYAPASDEQITAILEFSGIDPSNYSNPLKSIEEIKEVPPSKPKSKKKKEVKDIDTVEVVDTEQIEETDKED